MPSINIQIIKHLLFDQLDEPVIYRAFYWEATLKLLNKI